MNGDLPNRPKTGATKAAMKGSDFGTIWQNRQQRQTHLLRIYLWVVAMISLAWVVGYTNCSFSWLMAIFVVTLTIWRTKIFRITEEHLMNEQLLVHRKRAMRGSETVEWLNFIINRWCLFSSNALSDVLKKRIDPILRRFKPSLLDHVTIKSLTFGDQAPNIHHIQVFEMSDGLPGGRKQASWLNVGKPPKELIKLDKYHVVLDMEAGLHCEQFKMVLQTKIAGMPAGPDILVENLKVEGRLHAKVTFSIDVPFPHISCVNISFDEKPDIWFSVKILRSLQLMEIPVLKNWIHNLVLDLVCLSAVDPYKFEIDFTKVSPTVGPILKPASVPAVGVLSVLVSAEGYSNPDVITYSADDVTFCTLQINDDVIRTKETKQGQPWCHGCSFLVRNLQSDKLTLDVENKQMLSSVSVATYELILSNYSFTDGKSIDAVLDKEETSLKRPLSVHLEYTELPAIQITQSPPVHYRISHKATTCGVLYICVHNGFNLMSMDEDNVSDPYCVIFANRKKVQTSHHVRKSVNPRWETSTEIVVDDYTKTALQFLVYDWDGRNANDDDFLGAAHLTLRMEEPYVVHKPLPLSYNILNVGQVSEADLGSIVVTVIFRPVQSVTDITQQSLAERMKLSADAQRLPEIRSPTNVKTILHRRADASDDQNAASKSSGGTDVFKLLSQGHGILELNIMCARDLVAMDSNGFSDPYVEVKIGKDKKFQTTVKKKTLNPVWDESVTTQLPEGEEKLELSVWDKDPLMMKDFIGSVEFNAEDLKRISSIGEPGWYLLQKTKSGQIKLGIKVLTQDMKGCLDELSVFANRHMPTIPDDNVFLDSEKIEAEVAPQQVESYGTLPKEKEKKSSTGFSPLKRSLSEDQVNKSDKFRFFRSKPIEKESAVRSVSAADVNTRRTQSSESLSSTEYDNSSADPNRASEKFYNVKGEIKMVRINDTAVAKFKGQLYCKLRIDSRSDVQRREKFSPGRVVGKTPNIKLESGESSMEFSFEIDKGGGIPGDSLFIFDIKNTVKNAHVATRGYTLNNMFDGSSVCAHWLPKQNDIQFMVQMTRNDIPSVNKKPSGSRRSLSRLTQSFRRPKPEPVVQVKRQSAPGDSLLRKSIMTSNRGSDSENVERENLSESRSTAAMPEVVTPTGAVVTVTPAVTPPAPNVKPERTRKPEVHQFQWDFHTDLNVARLEPDLIVTPGAKASASRPARDKSAGIAQSKPVVLVNGVDDPTADDNEFFDAEVGEPTIKVGKRFSVTTDI